MELRYNYFYANACHVCKQFGEKVFLKRCGKCTMIAYCSQEHQREHWPRHKDLCNAICNVLKDNKMSNFFNGMINLCTEKWAQTKMNFMLLVAIKLGRKLEHYEEQMFKFLRSCATCHDRNAKVLVDCPNCPNTSFCTKHKNDRTHKKLCYLLKLCFKLDMASVMHERQIPEIQIPYHVNYLSLPGNMKDFIDRYIKEHNTLHVSMEEQTIINAEYLTRPLTFLYTVQKLRYTLRNDSMVIHIIAANMIEIDGVELWEILLHWLQSVTIVKIVLIGPELSAGSVSLNLCKICQCSNKQLFIQMYGTLYESYINDNSYIEPNFIIGYNAGIHECEDFKNDTWTESLQMISKQNCPFILTSYTRSEAEKEQMRLNAVLGSDINIGIYSAISYFADKRVSL